MTNLIKNENFSEALHNLVAGRFSIANEEVTFHDGDTLPSDVKIQAELDRLQAEYDAQQYARDRKEEYDALNQFEMQFDDKEDGTTTWEDAINAIKTKYPKG
jgi:hypothetical protein